MKNETGGPKNTGTADFFRFLQKSCKNLLTGCIQGDNIIDAVRTADTDAKKYFQENFKKCLTNISASSIIFKSPVSDGSLKTEQYSERKKPMCGFPEKETAMNLSKAETETSQQKSQNKQSIMESLILAQDERWRRA